MTEIETLREELAEAKAALEKARTFQNENAKIAVRMAEENKRLRESLAYLPREKANATTEEVWAALHPPEPAPSGSIPAQTSQRSTNQEAQHARKHDAVSGTDTGTEGEDGRGSRGLHCADGDAGRTAQEPLPVAGPDGAGGERDVGEQGNHQGQRRDATRRGEGRVAPPAPVASEPKTSAAAGVVCECGHTEAEHGQPGCLYECCLGFRPALDALRAAPAPREPCCDLASRGTHRKGCTGEPRSQQLADALGREAPLTDADSLFVRALEDYWTPERGHWQDPELFEVVVKAARAAARDRETKKE